MAQDYPPPANLDNAYKPSVRIAELPATASIEEILQVLDRDGGVILTDFLTPEQLAAVEAETAPYLKTEQADAAGYSIIPKETTVLNGLVGKSPTMAGVCEHPHLAALREHILAATGSVRQEEASFDYRVEPLLSVSLSFRIGHGAPRQRLHRDDVIFVTDHSAARGPYSLRNESEFACLVAACETKQENGATMFVPGSHRWDDQRQPRLDEITFAEMKKGSALIFLGSAYHGGGHNSVPGFTRVVHGLFFCRGNLRTEENQFLAVPRSKALQMSPAMQALLGYKLPQFCSLGLYEGGDVSANLRGALAFASS